MASYSCSQNTFEGKTFKYCLRDVSETNSQDIVYFFHGLGGDEETWFTQFLGTKFIYNHWTLHGYKPRIITVSFGPEWLLAQNSKSQTLGLMANRIMPYLENKVGGLQKGRRHIVGQSMGGFNAAEISLRYPRMFSKVVLLCPALSDVSPFAPMQEVLDYVDRTGADLKHVLLMRQVSLHFFSTPNDWSQHDPVELVRKVKTSTRFYLTCGQQDEYGFQEGSDYFFAYAHNRLIPVELVRVPGPHCSFDRLSAADFIMRE
jgi:pimeloyl-ACP methyl ester carboxylesterase